MRAPQVGADITRLQEDAKGIKERLKHEHSEHKSVQTTKILSNFEVRAICVSIPFSLRQLSL